MEARQRTLLAADAEICATVETSAEPCPQCAGPMVVRKSLRRRVVTLRHGAFTAVETERVCARGCTQASGAKLTRRSADLRAAVPPGAVYGYDIEVFVGVQRFVLHRQRLEIRDALCRGYGIELSTGQVSALAARFVAHLEALHRQHAPALARALAEDGGYPLHVDATGEDGRGTLFVAYAGWRHWVLGAWKLPTECAEAILPHLQGVVQDFGVPCAVVRDLGRAITEAVATALDGRSVPIFCCQFHLLRDVGTDLLKADHGRLQALFRELGVRAKLRTLARDLGRRLGPGVPALRMDVQQWIEREERLPAGPSGRAVVRAMAQWALDYQDDTRHQGFPFDRPYLALYRRCDLLWRATTTLARRAPADAALRSALDRLRATLRPLQADAEARQLVRRLEARADLLDRLRAVLRLDADADLGSRESDSSPEALAKSLAETQRAFRTFVRDLRQHRATPRLPSEERAMLDVVLSHLDRHAATLWGHVLAGPQPGTIRVVARTNNILEQFFHRLKHGERRRSGRKVLTHDFEAIPPGAALACNLSHPDYVTLVCGSLDELPARFSAIDAADRPALPDPAPELTRAALPLGDRRLVRRPAFRQRLVAACSRRQPQPNRLLTR